MVQTMHEKPGAEPGVDNLILVSSDTHIGPTLEQLREYCPKQYLEDFDSFAGSYRERSASIVGERSGGADELADAMRHLSPEEREALLARFNDNPITAQMMRNRQTAGHHEMHQRIRDMDADGLACEVIFHGSQNGQPVPFVEGHSLGAGLTTPFSFLGMNYELAAVGMHMYNSWLADVCTIEPERHIGLAHIPAWDPDASAKEVEWAAGKGLKGINFPAWRPGMPVLQDDAWEGFYAVVNELGLPLTNHGGAGDDQSWPQAESTSLLGLESAYHSKRLIWTFAYHGVFDDYPNLKLMIAEIPGEWWPFLMREMDTSPGAAGRPGAMSLGPADRRSPSEMCATSVFHGATFMSRREAQHAVEHGYVDNIIWGSDYPHVEGTWQAPGEGGLEPQTHLSLRDTFSGLAEDDIRRMVGLNGIRAYDLDQEALQKVANRICAPSFEEISTPLDDADIPEAHGMFVFRRHGPWA